MRNNIMRFLKKYGWIAPAITLFLCLFSQTAQASEIDLKIPLLDVEYNFWEIGRASCRERV